MRRPFALSSLCLSAALLAPTGCDSPEKTKTYRPGDGTRTLRKIAAKQRAGFTPLSLADFEVFHAKRPRPGDPPTWAEKDGVISCTGTPFGYLYSKKPYRNFELVFEYRFERPRERSDYAKLNTGCFIFIQGEHRRWPICLEVQGKWLEMGAIKSNARHIQPVVSDEQKARTEARTAPGNWNEIRIQAREGEVASRINGSTVGGAATTELKDGLIGFQSEGSKVEFRNIRIRVLP